MNIKFNPRSLVNQNAERRLMEEATGFLQNGHFGMAEERLAELLLNNPKQVDALNLLGVIRAQCGDFAGAIDFIKRAISINSKNPASYYNRGLALLELGNPTKAIDDFKTAITLNPIYAQAYNGQGNAYSDLHQNSAAIKSFKEAVRINPEYADAWNNLGNALSASKNISQAVACYQRAIAHQPHFVEAFVNLANAYVEVKDFDNSMRCSRTALDINPEFDYLLGDYVHTKLRAASWVKLNEEAEALKEAVSRSIPLVKPFVALGVFDDPALHKRVAELYVQTRYPQSHALGPIPARKMGGKIRIGYYSADFRNHAIAYLIAEMLERHDKDVFDIYAFNLSSVPRDAMSERLFSAATQIVDLVEHSDRSAAQLSRAMGIDIAVDLGGHTVDSRIGIFAHRCAPVQVNYLGYPGTLGAPYYDYVIADRHVIPLDQRQHYTEQLAYLPHCYQVNDSKRKIAERVFSRSELGLPEHAFVFCCFNNGYKILPETFDGWMRILHAVHDSVLWLLDQHPLATQSLQREAQVRGIDSHRLVFAPRMPLPDHLARHKAADLFIDTLPYNAHTTASDALWAGLPLITRMGKSFAARVAGSLLLAMDLPELIADTQTDFESKAIQYAKDPVALANIKRKLSGNLSTSPLFNAQLFTRHIEQAYRVMHARQQSDLAPEHFAVEA
jgi:predicted O-linked N-acetylglucosamine transferase (SPINDLY family)